MNQLRRNSSILRASLLVAALSVGACSSRNAMPSDSTAVASTGAQPGAMSGMNGTGGMSGVSGMNGSRTPSLSVDHEFLRMMSDHHKGLIALVHPALERKDVSGIIREAKKLDTEQDAELDTMTIMLRQKYNDPYNPQVMAEHQAMADTLKSLGGSTYDRAFRQDVIRHHQEAITMINEYLPRATDPKVKAMAEKMRALQGKEIIELQAQLSHQ